MNTELTLSELGERAAIERFVGHLPTRSDVTVGAGDDAAVITPAGQDTSFVMTSDPVIQGIHFDASADPERVGRKAVGRTLSDIAAMGASPAWLLMNLVGPSATPMSVIDGIMRGAGAMSALFNAAIVGGDLAEGPVLEVHAFGVGTVPRGSARLRSMALPGDGIYVTGQLGGSSLGRHLDVTPRVEEGLFLREWASAMIDISDGLGSDLRHIVRASGVDAVIDIDAIPISPDACRLDDGRTAWEHAMTDGEDFELLFTLKRGREASFAKQWQSRFDLPCTCIGEIAEGCAGIMLRDPNGHCKAWEGTGFSHFRADDEG